MSKRIARLNEQLKRELSELIRSEVRDPRVGPVTITGVDIAADRLGDIDLAGQCQGQRPERRIEIVIIGKPAESLSEAWVKRRRLVPAELCRGVLQHRQGDLLGRLPAAERIGIVADEEKPVIGGKIVHKPHRRGKTAEQGRHRPRGDAGKRQRGGSDLSGCYFHLPHSRLPGVVMLHKAARDPVPAGKDRQQGEKNSGI